MKKNMLILACISTTVAHGMETNSLLAITTNSLSMTYCGTKINLTKGSSFDASNKVKFMVVGRVQQRTLQAPSFGDIFEVGRIDYRNGNVNIYERNKETDSASDDDTYKPYSNKDNKKLCKNTSKKLLTSKAMSILEPRIAREFFSEKGFYYHVIRQNPEKQNSSFCCEYNDDEAIIEASKDLASCYKIVLAKGLQELSDNEEKSIALPTLSADVGFPPKKAARIAVPTILEWVKKNPSAYARIELFVKKRSEFKLYTELLLQYADFELYTKALQ